MEQNKNSETDLNMCETVVNNNWGKDTSNKLQAKRIFH